MLRIRLLLLLKCFLVGVGRSQINLSSERVPELPVHYPSPSQTHIFKESIPLIFTRDDIIGKDSVQLGHLHELTFVVRHKNVNQIAAILNDISNTSSQNYGHHLSKEQIDSLTSNQESRAAVVSCLLSIGASISSEIQSWEYITATAPVGSWELFFQSTFYKYYQLQQNGSKKEFIRTHEYWIPKGMNDHIESVFNIIQLPHRLMGKQKEVCEEFLCPSAKYHEIESNYAKIREFYDIGSAVGKKESSQGVFAIDHRCEGFDNLDSSDQSTKFIIKNIEDSSARKGPSNLSSYLDNTITSSPESSTSYHCTDAYFSDWLMMMAKIAIPPLVVSLAMDIPETFLSKSELDAFNTLAIKFGCMGVTIVAPSGSYRSRDRGVDIDDQVDYSLIPSFPASNPYVTAVAMSMVRTLR
jgi:subtilase family serine protease